MRKTNVYIDARCLVRDNPSGITHYVASILTELNRISDELDADKSIQYHLIVPFRHRWKLGRYQLRNFRVHYVPLPFRGYNFLIRKRLLPPIDLFFGRGVYIFPEIATMPLFFSKSISIIYDAVHDAMPETMDEKMLNLVKMNVETSIQDSNRIVTISNFSLNEISKPFKKYVNKFRIITPSVDKTLFYPRSSSEVTTVLARYEIFGKYILAVGNFEPRKNYEKLFEAYSLLPRSIKDSHQLLIVGASSWNSQPLYESKLEYNKNGSRIIARLSSIPDSDMPAIYSGASMLVYPSLYEGFGMPILEAMACGIPVLSANNSALPEAFGNAAIQTSETDSGKLSADILKIIEWSDPERSTQIQKGFKHVDSFVTWKDCAIRLNEVVKEVTA